LCHESAARATQRRCHSLERRPGSSRRALLPRDAFRQRVRAALAAHRELALSLNDSRRIPRRASVFCIRVSVLRRRPRNEKRRFYHRTPAAVGHSGRVKCGGFCRAYIETVPAEVTDGQVKITFTPKVENPQICAVEILAQ
jgi:hypothetical protein